MAQRRDPADIKKISQLTVRLSRMKQEVAVQRGKAIALDLLNDALLEQRNALLLQMAGAREGGEEDMRALFEGTFAAAWCACGDCPQCDAQEGRAAMVAVRRPINFTQLLDSIEDMTSALGQRPGEHDMATLVKQVETYNEPCDVQVSVQRAWVRNAQGVRMEMMVLVAGPQVGASFMGDVVLEASVKEQLADLFGKLGDGDAEG